ncbi:GNAT family N-acetyltransferase [Nocardioides sp. DS6]|uniref:GNAT family N-acetyltransferase n=1 Tax=Nocardioides eburneus TaxID=3231482 RepID=A0ABV3T161_9ACTN
MNDLLQTPANLPDGWTARGPELDDLPRLVALRSADKNPFTGSSGVAEETVESEIAGLKSWTRRQQVAVDPDGVVRAWATVHDRAAGRTMVHLYVDRGDYPGVDRAADVAASLYAWMEERARAIARMRGLTGTQLDASPYAEDTVQRGWLEAAGYTKVRTWLQMTRPVDPDEAETLPAPRPGVTVRRVGTHDNGLPVAADLRTVHQMLEESFADHFNSYRESFPEFVQRLREDPGHRWDHWWLAFVDDPERPDGPPLPAGALVASLLQPGPNGKEGSYVEYIGVNRRARGRGVAKALLFAVIGDVAERGGDRVGLEVDADSPTGADGLYTSLGWTTDYVTESWHKDI